MTTLKTLMLQLCVITGTAAYTWSLTRPPNEHFAWGINVLALAQLCSIVLIACSIAEMLRSAVDRPDQLQNI